MRHWDRLKLTIWSMTEKPWKQYLEKTIALFIQVDMTECNLIIATEQRFQHGFFLILCKSLTVACNSDLDCSVLCLLCLHDSHQAFCCSYSSIHKTLIDYCYRMRSMLPVLLLKISLQCSFTAESALKQLLRLYFSSGAMTKILHNVWFFYSFPFFSEFFAFLLLWDVEKLGFCCKLINLRVVRDDLWYWEAALNLRNFKGLTTTRDSTYFKKWVFLLYVLL